MENEDDKIRQLFAESIPELSSDILFMEKIEARINIMDLFKEKEKKMKKRSRTAALISGCAGFLCGIILTLLYPYITKFFISIFSEFTLPSLTIEMVSEISTLLLISLSSIATVFSSYYVFSGRISFHRI